MNPISKGTGVALITPFQPSGIVDFQGLTRLINHVIDGGVDYVVTLGTTGETATLTVAEKKEIVNHTVTTVAGRVPVILGHGGNNTAALIDGLQQLDLTGISALLSVSPYYNKPTQAGIIAHYTALAAATELPLILYNVPGRTSSNLTADTTLHLAHKVDNIKAIKEASGSIEQCMAIVAGRPNDFLVISGEDALTLPMLSFGMDGVISVVANAFPKEYSDMVRAGLAGDFTTARTLHFELLHLIDLLFAEGNPGGVKCALKHLGICGDTLRLPLVNVSNDTDKAIKQAVKALKK